MKSSAIMQRPIKQRVTLLRPIPAGIIANGPGKGCFPSIAWLFALVLAGGLALAAPALAAMSSSGSGNNSSGSAAAGAGSGNTAGGSGSPSAGGGEKILQVAMPPCGTCHQVKAGINQPGPSLAGIATRASQRIKSSDYKGKAKDAKAYIRESIMDPNAYLVPGPGYEASGKSLMPTTYAQTLKPEQVDQIVNYLMTLK